MNILAVRSILHFPVSSGIGAATSDRAHVLVLSMCIECALGHEKCHWSGKECSHQVADVQC